MKSRKKTTTEDEQEIIKLYLLGEKNFIIGKKFNIDRHTVSAIIKRNKIKTKLTLSYNDPVIQDKMVELYLEGKHYSEIAKTLNVCEKSVISILHKRSVRSIKKVDKLSKEHEQFIKENYPLYGAGYCAKKLGFPTQRIGGWARKHNLRRIYVTEEGLKPCQKCHRLKEKDQFFVLEKVKKTGCFTYCKDCVSLYNKDYRVKKKILNPPKPRQRGIRDGKTNWVFTEDRIKFLKEFYPIYGVDYCVEKLGLTRGQIFSKVNTLKLVRERNGPKQCRNCKTLKSSENFPKKRHVCKFCINLENRKNYNDNINEKILSSLRRRVHSLLFGKAKKSDRTMNLVGCSIEFYIKYLESKFLTGMTWENYGKGGWNIDHIIPCSKFDLANPEQQKKCFHYTNTTPLWETTEIARSYGDLYSIGNLNKSNKILQM